MKGLFPLVIRAFDIPSLEDQQNALVSVFVALSEQHGVSTVLTDCLRTPRPVFEVLLNPDAIRLLAALQAKGLAIADQNHQPMKADQVAALAPQAGPITLYRPLFDRGRVLFGPASGLTISLRTETIPSQDHITDERLAAKFFRSATDPASIRFSPQLYKALNKSRTPKRMDIVYTWVDGAEPGWLAKRQQFNALRPSADSESINRFENNNELLYSLRSVLRNFNRVGNIFLVTDNQRPDFLAEFGDRVQIVDHTEIIPPSAKLPTYNSHVIESCLHKIPTLRKRFLYLNDDFLFAAPSCPQDFFDNRGRPKCFFSVRHKIPQGKATPDTLAVDAAAINLRDLLDARFSHSISEKFQHTPVAIRRKTMRRTEAEFPAEFLSLRQNQFRSLNDLSPTGSLYQHFSLMKRWSVTGRIKYRYYDLDDRFLLLKMYKLGIEPEQKRPKVYCINNTGTEMRRSLNRVFLSRLLESIYPAQADARPGLRRFVFNGLLVIWASVGRAGR